VVQVGVPGSATPPSELIKVLIIDDNPLDAELSLMQLRRANLATECVIAADEAELRVALRTFVPSVILCDFSFPDFDGLMAQGIVREAYPDAPLIFVSGSISEDRAVKALQSGAVDYVLKSSLLRLPSAVRRAVREARERTRLEISLAGAEERVRRQAERLEALWRVTNNPTLRGEALMIAMLRQAAEAIRPGQRFRGVIGRIERDDVVVVCVGVNPTDTDLATTFPPVGSRTPLAATVLKRPARTQAWDDLIPAGEIPRAVARMGWRAVLSTQFEVGDVQYSLSFASQEPMTTTFGPEDSVYIELLASSFANLLQVNGLEASLRDEEQRSRFHAERLEALWRLINDQDVRNEDMLQLMLEQATTAIGPGDTYQGNLWHVRDTELILEASTNAPERPPHFQPQIGYTMPLEASFVEKILAEGGGTRAWTDVQATAYSSPHARATGARALIVRTFVAGGSTWALSFLLGETASQAMGQQERAYIEVLALFFANHLQQRWQFDRIQYQQSHDVLTGLLNRSQFRSQARMASSESERYAVILVDVNSFHEINESYGHTIGDALLVEVGSALRERASADEIVGRVGGDVFGIYVPNPISREFVRGRALDFAQVFARSFSTGDGKGKEFVALTASLGIATAPENGSKIEAILSHADAAIYATKERGHGSMVFYEPGMEGDAQRRATLRNELIDAIATDQFTLYYQPHLEISSGMVSGCEALIRWNHPTRGLLLPGHFIPFAEETGIITSIDAWVMRNAFAAANELSALRPGFRLYFNLSGRQASDPKLIRAFVNAAREGVVLNNIGVEITETDAMRDVEATRRVCRALMRLNVTIAIDDFGTGYSSLSSLKRLPVDVVKIDRSFISGVLSDRHDETIAETIISITERFGFESLAEGVERPEEIEWLRARSCRYVQGYAVCHPLPLAEFKSWLLAREQLKASPRVPV
jgi:diguanylate cyclase (GGDEF)-like protein